MTAVMLAISQKDLTDSLVQAMVRGEQQWLISTLAAFMPGLWTLSLMLHLSRPYMVRMVRKLTLRFAADVWWLSFVLVRDAVMIITFALSLVFFLPGFARNIALPLTGPVAGVFLFWALLVKLTGDVDDNPRHYRLATYFMVAGALLWLVPQVLAIETTSQPFFAPLVSALTSTNHPDLATWILMSSVVLVALTGAYIFNFVIGDAMRQAPQPAPQPSEPRSADAAPAP
jgi:hypothetical protein